MNGTEDNDADGLPPALARYIPLAVWVLAIATLVFIPLKISSLGYVPNDDALRSVGKIFSGKTWQDVLVMRPEITIDHNAGWHMILAAVHRATGWDADALVQFSVIGLMLAVFITPLVFTSRPEAWLAALLSTLALSQPVVQRIALGRPYILVMAATMAILAMWRDAPPRPRAAMLAATAALFALCAWVHGCWYLYILVPAAFFAVQRWRHGFLLLGCWITGAVAGGIMTGRPVDFFREQTILLFSYFGRTDVVLQRMLVTEFKPFDGAPMLAMLVVLLLAARALRGKWSAAVLRDPVLMLTAMGWILGWNVRRFWLDWGIPALLVWLFFQYREVWRDHVRANSLGRLCAAGMLCVGLFLATTADIESRWSDSLGREYIEEGNPRLAGWLPEPGGIVYNDSMWTYYETFFKNPRAPWRYVLGDEATLMRQDDLEIFRRIQWNNYNFAAYQPWVEKMRPGDRMFVRRNQPVPPDIPQLEWLRATANIWIGRPPRAQAAPQKSP